MVPRGSVLPQTYLYQTRTWTITVALGHSLIHHTYHMDVDTSTGRHATHMHMHGRSGGPMCPYLEAGMEAFASSSV